MTRPQPWQLQLMLMLLLAILSSRQVSSQLPGGVYSSGATRSGKFTAVRPMFVLLGDSITEFSFEEYGWGSLLSTEYLRRADVINRGFGGYNSQLGVYVMDEFLSSFKPHTIKLVTIGFGANDACIPGAGW
eukprot:jgi/Chrzof1/8068/UNPLg00113.t1